MQECVLVKGTWVLCCCCLPASGVCMRRWPAWRLRATSARTIMIRSRAPRCVANKQRLIISEPTPQPPRSPRACTHKREGWQQQQASLAGSSPRCLFSTTLLTPCCLRPAAAALRCLRPLAPLHSARSRGRGGGAAEAESRVRRAHRALQAARGGVQVIHGPGKTGAGRVPPWTLPWQAASSCPRYGSGRQGRPLRPTGAASALVANRTALFFSFLPVYLLFLSFPARLRGPG